MSEPVRTEIESGVATVTIDRPDAMNALDWATKTALLSALETVAADTAVRAVVLTGAGSRAVLRRPGPPRAHRSARRDDMDTLSRTVPEHYSPMPRCCATMPKPVIAAVNGVAAGAGAGLRVRVRLPDRRRHRRLQPGLHRDRALGRLRLVVDPAAAGRHGQGQGAAAAPRTVGAQEALSLGLATRVVPAADVLPESLELARQLAAGPTVAYGAVRRASPSPPRIPSTRRSPTRAS
jgi:2-(1,2-epoxy-1,2-dihydrophenyl)acetyl-CoA isomerase